MACTALTARSCRAGALAGGSRRRVTEAQPRQRVAVVSRGFKVEISHGGKSTVLDVPEGENILSVALDHGLDLPHDCRLGVCMTCPAKLTSGQVEAAGCMLSDDVSEKGYTLLCMAQPLSDCKIKTVSEDELLDLQLVAGNTTS